MNTKNFVPPGKAVLLMLPILLMLASKNVFAKHKSLTIAGSLTNSEIKKIYFRQGESIDSASVSSGKFSKTLHLDNGAYLNIDFGNRFQMNAFLQPGDVIRFEVKDDNFQNIKATGPVADRLNYFIKKDRLLSSVLVDEYFRYLNSKEPFEFLKTTDSLHNQLNLLLDKSGLKNKSFVELERKNILYYAAWLRMNYNYAHWAYTKQKFDYGDTAFFRFTSALDRNDESLLRKLDYFKSYITSYVFYQSNLLWKRDSSYKHMENGSVLAQFDVISRFFKSPVIKNYLYYDMISAYMEFYDANKSFTSALGAFNKLCTDDSLKMEIADIYARKVLLVKGKPAPDFSFYDVGGKKYTLDDLKGNLLIIDVWATWCGPCIREVPFWDSLKQKYANAPIRFISISIDANKISWERHIAKKNQTDHYLATGAWNSELCKNYLIRGIPQFIFLDAEGKFISSNAPLPSDPKLGKMIEAALNEHDKTKALRLR